QFPNATVIERHAIAPTSSEQVSADGQWRSRYTCADDKCTATTLTLIAASGAKRDVRVAGSINELQWSPLGHALAIKVGSDAGSEIRVIVDPARDEPRVLASRVGGFAWRRDGKSLIVEANLGAPGIMLVRLTLDGTQSPVAKLPGLPPYLYASPDRRRFAYT